ncbi:MBL fold metallo-hydrolase [Thermaurantimonas aggregans]|uniref:MBL fold metallo-hydrolase n=1 Tax=Thermaurantimonas aggregans TaxID=2173829 RepID=UPI0023F521F0|nr:MBL fold metallo-hydrolase [Thermaurantimonas aggregans]MCX8149678.1 MBL fold metallo-hydrolase [Thermaurantimonas aggregans]
MKISFLGGTSTVTGSKHLLEVGNKKILLDCGLFQGLKELRLLNRAPFPVSPSSIDAVIISHGHLDHVGYLPVLVKNGFRGYIFCTEATAEIMKIILQDSARIQMEEAERARREGYSRHSDPKPLYTTDDVEDVFPLVRVIAFNETIELTKSISFRLTPAGHILGASVITLEIEGKKIVFTGDLGRYNDLLLPPPEPVSEADVLLCESTYGHTLHLTQYEEIEKRLIKHIVYAWENKSLLLIPGFAVERAQVLMYLISKLKHSGRIPPIALYLDSPMASAVSDVFGRFSELLKIDGLELYRALDSYDFVESLEESNKIVHSSQPRVVIAGGGMLAGGRALNYLFEHLENPKSILLLTGYQAEGTRGRAILNGMDELKIFGRYLKIRMRTDHIDGLSSHADRGDILRWIEHFRAYPKLIFLVHGEAHSADSLRLKLKDTFRNTEVLIPKIGDSFELF